MPLITTCGDLIAFCLRSSGINGIGQTPQPEDANDGLQFLASMVAQWQRKRWLVWSLADTAFTSTGAAAYTVGPAGNFAIARPDKIDSAFARMNAGSAQPLDIPLGIIQSREDYNFITLKSLSTFPAAVWYESAYPMGLLHFWPIPSTQFDLHIATKAALPAYTALTDLLGLPPEYVEAAIWSLCVRLEMAYGLDPRPAHVQAMRAALNVIRTANVQVTELKLPALGGRGNGGVAAGASPGFQSGWMA